MYKFGSKALPGWERMGDESFHIGSYLLSLQLVLAQPWLEKSTDGKQSLDSSLNQVIDISMA